MVVAAFIIAAGVIVEVCAMLRAPMGYQDETGFHAGAPGTENEDGRLWLNPS